MMSPVVRRLGFWCLALLLAAGCAPREPAPAVPSIPFRVLRTLPHDPGAFTQGLVFHEGVLYESTGLYGRSSLRKVDLETGAVLQKVDLPESVFGEGLAWLNGLFYQLTWRENLVLVYDATNLAPKARLPIAGEGWGVVPRNGELIVSDGTSRLRFYDPAEMTLKRGLTVTENGRPLARLNELELIDGSLYANIWGEASIVRIDLQSGRVTGRLDASSLVPKEHRDSHEAVLNGIAYDPETRRVFITGKLWPVLYELTLETDS